MGVWENALTPTLPFAHALSRKTPEVLLLLNQLANALCAPATTPMPITITDCTVARGAVLRAYGVLVGGDVERRATSSTGRMTSAAGAVDPSMRLISCSIARRSSS